MGPKISGAAGSGSFKLPKRIQEISEFDDQSITDYEGLLGSEYRNQFLIAIANGPKMGWVDGWYDYILDENYDFIFENSAIILPVSEDFFSFNSAAYGLEMWLTNAGVLRQAVNGGRIKLVKASNGLETKPAGQDLPIVLRMSSTTNFIGFNDYSGGDLLELTFNAQVNTEWVYLSRGQRGFNFDAVAKLANPNGEQEYLKFECQYESAPGSNTWINVETCYRARCVKGFINMTGSISHFLDDVSNYAKKRFRFVLSSDSANSVNLEKFSVNYTAAWNFG